MEAVKQCVLTQKAHSNAHVMEDLNLILMATVLVSLLSMCFALAREIKSSLLCSQISMNANLVVIIANSSALTLKAHSSAVVDQDSAAMEQPAWTSTSVL